MDIAHAVASRLTEVRIRQALGEAQRARREVLREDLFDGDCARCVRRARAADARVRRLEAALHARRQN